MRRLFRHPVARRLLGAGLLLAACQTWAGTVGSIQPPGEEFILDLAGTPDAFGYTRDLLTRVLELEGYRVHVRNAGSIPTTRLERMLERGKLSAFILGRTPARDRQLLLVDVPMTGNLMNRRILFIPQGAQSDYDDITTLDDLRRSSKVAGLGEAWADRQVWTANNLPFLALGGDWKRLYGMVASQNRDIDYLPRGAQEMASEWRIHRELQVERNLVLVYGEDHVLYVSPEAPELYAALLKVIPKAFESGLIDQLAKQHFKAVFAPPVNLHERRVIHLSSSEQGVSVTD